ncbi:Prefoldin beta-like protein [Auricularia subglabra TFB-10046 SS5]|nr:Prefoldin beta-like protein [Auricularia subglabra TFB-10046 SS5]
MSTSASKAPAKGKAKGKALLSDQEVQATYQRLQSELQAISSKVNELEMESEEHELVLKTLTEALEKDPGRKCFRLIGGVLVERTVQDVVPSLATTRDGIRTAIATLSNQFKSKEEEFSTLVKDYNIRAVRT